MFTSVHVQTRTATLAYDSIYLHSWHSTLGVILRKLSWSGVVRKGYRWRSGEQWMVLERASRQLSPSGGNVLQGMSSEWHKTNMWSIYKMELTIQYYYSQQGTHLWLWSSLSMDWHRNRKGKHESIQILRCWCQHIMLYEHRSSSLCYSDPHLMIIMLQR
jgi:hypothetical protein